MAKKRAGTQLEALQLDALERPEVRAAVLKRLVPLLEKVPVVTLHQLCQTLETMLGDE